MTEASTPEQLSAPPSPRRASAPFRFFTSFTLQEATGLRAATLPQLLDLLRTAPERCIYHHTHDFLRAHHYLTPEPTNDFAYWVQEILGERPLGELLASIDILNYPSLSSLREVFVAAIEGYLQRRPLAHLRFVAEGEEFFFIKSLHIVMPTGAVAWTLEEFTQRLSNLSIDALYFHIFDSRLRLGRHTNDFALWFEEQLGESALAAEATALDPYAHTLEALRAQLVALCHSRQPGPSRHV